MDLPTLCKRKWGSVAAAERVIGLSDGMLRSITTTGRTTTRTLARIREALQPTREEWADVLDGFGVGLPETETGGEGD